MLRVEQAVVSRAGQALCAPLTFALAAGTCLHIQGANGAGKTTLMKSLAGLRALQSGQIYWQDRQQPEWGDDYGAQLHYLGHCDALKDILSPLENLHIYSRLQGVDLSESAALQALITVGLASFADLPVRQLSQGQQRRATLARFLAISRPLWLLDEPLVGLDAAGQLQLGVWIADHIRLGGIAVLSSHQLVPETIPQVSILPLVPA